MGYLSRIVQNNGNNSSVYNNGKDKKAVSSATF